MLAVDKARRAVGRLVRPERNRNGGANGTIHWHYCQRAGHIVKDYRRKGRLCLACDSISQVITASPTWLPLSPRLSFRSSGSPRR